MNVTTFSLVVVLILIWVNYTIADIIGNTRIYNPFYINISIVIGYIMYLFL